VGTKLAFQFLFAAVIALVLYFGPPQLDYVGIPGAPQYLHLGWWFMPIAAIVIVGFSNAVNLTDGLDSLAGSSSSIAFACYGLIAFLQDQIYLAAFCFIVVGALFAFLWHNAYPADMCMGDTGSLALGATLALVALMTTQWLLLPIIGLVFVAEAGSVMLQVGYFKLTKRLYGEGRRIFRMSPLHYHFELVGWSQMQVKERFWIVGVLSSMAGVALALT
jgi:phospho-N-acetylmuramoyl-pentapeptide-transferase